MIRIWIAGWMLAPILYAQSASTVTTFGSRSESGMDGHGNQLYSQEVTISTENYEVDTFWSRFHNPDNKTKKFTQLTTKATAQMMVEASSACSIAGKGQLPAHGCSGQKPFLVNDEAVSGLNNGDSVSLIFRPAYDEEKGIKTYNSTDNSVVYPLDIGRNGEFYKSTATVQAGSKQTFFGFFTNIFDFFINDTTFNFFNFFNLNTIADSKSVAASSGAADRRQRYIANIIGGVDQDHLISKPYKGNPATQIDAMTRLNNPVSLLHYDEATKVTAVSSCGLICRIMRGFGLNAWLPFFSNAKVTTLESDTITVDTENALLSAAGKITGQSYQKVTATTDTQKLSFLDSMINMMSSMMNMMKTMMFGSKAPIVADPVEIVYDFSAKPMTLTLAVTDNGQQVDRFETFKLTGLRSTYGNTVNQCQVKYKGGFFGFGSWTDTFYASSGTTSTGTHTNGSIDTHAEWVDWCQQQLTDKGIDDYLSSTSSGGFFSLFSSFFSFFGGSGSSYEILDFKNGLKRGLILNLTKETLTPVNTLNTTQIKLINVKH